MQNSNNTNALKAIKGIRQIPWHFAQGYWFFVTGLFAGYMCQFISKRDFTMKTFKQKQLALAIGSALMVMAGGAQAAGAPTLRATNPNLITATSDAVTPSSSLAGRGLYDGTGYNGNLTVTLNFNAGVATATEAGTGYAIFGQLDAGADGFVVNSDSDPVVSAAKDDVTISVAPVGGTAMTLPMIASNFTANIAGATDSGPVGSSAGSGTIMINPGSASPSTPNPAFRMGAAGVLQWTADLASSVWTDVLLAVNTPALANATTRNGISTIEATAPGGTGTGAVVAAPTVANSTAMAAVVASASVHNAVAPQPIVGTHGNGTGLVDGVIIDTLTPVSTAFSGTNITLTTKAGACALVNKNGAAVPVTFGTAVNTTTDASATAVAIANDTSGGSRYPITITSPATVDWTINSADRAAAASSAKCFNTGISSGAGTLPLTVTTAAVLPSYTSVFSAAGTALTVALPVSSTLAVEDKATPIVTKVEYSAPDNNVPPLSNLIVTFSEPMQFMGHPFGEPFADGREIAQNILIGNDNLAALNLNDGTNISVINGINFSNGTGTLTVSGILASDLVGKAVTVNKGISFQEPNDVGYNIAVNQLDNVPSHTNVHNIHDSSTSSVQLGGGIQSQSGAVEAPSITAQTATLAAVQAINFSTTNVGGDTTAVAHTGTDPTKIATVVVKFAAGKEIALGAGKTKDQLAADLVLTVWDNNNGVAQQYQAWWWSGTNNTYSFQWHPTAADLTISAAGDTLTIKLPTELIYGNIDPWNTLDVAYLPQGNIDGVLVSKTAATVKVAAGDVAASLPLASLMGSNTNSTLYTQSISGYFTTTTAPALDSSIAAYLAKWVDTPVMGATYVTGITSGKITNPGDKVATDLAIEFVDQNGNIQNNISNGVSYNDVSSAILQQYMNGMTLNQLQFFAKQATANAAKLGTVASKEIAAEVTQSLADLAAGVKAGTTPAMQKQIPVYVKLVRSNDTAATGNTTGAQNYLNARALMAVTEDGARKAGGSNDKLDPIYQVMLDVTTGAISGRLTGSLGLHKITDTQTTRGLKFVDSYGNLYDSASSAGPVANGQVTTSANKAGGVATGTPSSFNLLLGVDSKGTNNLNLADTFVLAVLSENPTDATAYKQTLLTSANPAAANYVPFDANLITMKGTRTTLSNSATGFDLSKLKALPLANSTSWALYGIGAPDVKAGKDLMKAFDRNFVGLDITSGQPRSYWTNDGSSGDAAIALLGSKASVAVETGNQGGTTSTIVDASMKKGAAALAWSNDIQGNWSGPSSYAVPTLTDVLFVQQQQPTTTAAVAGAVKLPVGWSLVNIPGPVGSAVTALGAGVDAVIKVGAQANSTDQNDNCWNQAQTSATCTQNQFTWIKSTDGTMPALTAGEAVFVYSKLGGALE